MKIPFFCSYIPVELLTACGHEVVDISVFENEKYSLAYSCSLHDNICSYAKYLFSKIIDDDRQFDFVIVPKVCDAMKQLHSSLCYSGKIESFLLDVPGRTGDQSAKYLSSQYLSLLEKIAPDHFHQGKTDLLLAEKYAPTVFAHSLNPEEDHGQSVKIGVAGSSYSPALFRDIFKKFNAGGIFLRHCGHGIVSSGERQFSPTASLEQELLRLARYSLQNTICPRSDGGNLTNYIIAEIEKQQLAGLIFTTLKFCDFYAFELEKLKNILPAGFPCLYLENDLSVNSDEQNVTRIEAFMEKIMSGQPTTKKSRARAVAPSEIYSIGLDVGSTTTKGIMLKNGQEIIASTIIPTSINMKDSADAAFGKLIEQSSIGEENIFRTIYTGYGRTAFPDREQTTEITCHAAGVNFLRPQSGTIIDIGGQDSKAIRIDEAGNVLRFAMNDKCAAGTGRFLENMVQRMNINFDRFSDLSLAADHPTPISSMCSVFAESEVVSLMTKGIPVGSIARGLNFAIAERVCALVRKIQGEAPFILTGGLSLNAGFTGELENALACRVTIFAEAQLAGAIGAAVIGSRQESIDGRGGL
jgi:predicted CoA-substrate-specific enzyme activase